jgi:hypothetical protein
MTFSLAYTIINKPNDLEKTIIVVSNVLYDHQHACLCFSSPCHPIAATISVVTRVHGHGHPFRPFMVFPVSYTMNRCGKRSLAGKNIELESVYKKGQC